MFLLLCTGWPQPKLLGTFDCLSSTPFLHTMKKPFLHILSMGSEVMAIIYHNVCLVCFTFFLIVVIFPFSFDNLLTWIDKNAPSSLSIVDNKAHSVHSSGCEQKLRFLKMAKSSRLLQLTFSISCHHHNFHYHCHCHLWQPFHHHHQRKREWGENCPQSLDPENLARCKT